MARPSAPRRIPRWLARLPLGLYDVGFGWVLGRRFLRLEHRGRVSGLSRRAVLEVIGWDGPSPVVVSGFGERSQWLRNVRVTPTVRVTVGRETFDATAEVLDTEGARRHLATYAADHPRAASRLASLYADADDPRPHVAKLAGVVLPVVRFVPSADPAGRAS